MNDVEIRNLKRLESWYHNMWGKCNPLLVREHTADYYLRHDPSGPATKLTGDHYGQICAMAMQGKDTADFQFFFITEGDFVGALGRLIFTDGDQWDWVQLFRLEDARLAETWLPAMGVSIPMAYPKPENSWYDSAILDQDHTDLDANKQLVKNWFEDLAAGEDLTKHLEPIVRWHDMQDADIELTPDALQARLRALMQGDTAEGLKLHLIGEGDYVVATGLWSLGAEGRRWNWVQAFYIENGLIARSWINAIGGTDPSISYGPDSAWTLDVLPKDATRIGVQLQT